MLYQFVKDALNEGGSLSPSIISKYQVKKMSGTHSMFKFALDKEDASRCLIRYETSHKIFNNEPGLSLIMITDHESQGILARKMDKIETQFEEFLMYETEPDKVSDDELSAYLGRQFMKNHLMDDQFDEISFLNTLELHDPKGIYELSENQYEALNGKDPVFLLGCAGSGKTLVEISKALKIAHEDKTQGYFTFTELLKDSAKKLYHDYENAKGIKGKTSFYTIKEFMLKKLGYQEPNYFGFEKYLNWLNKGEYFIKYPKLKEIGRINLWIEIRGILKGFIGNKYYRILTLDNIKKHIKQEVIDGLVDLELIKLKEGSSSVYIIIDEEGLHDMALSDSTLQAYLEKVNYETPLIDEYAYVEALPSKYSVYDKTTKKLIHSFVKDHYQNHLESYNRKQLDDNDLARLIRYEHVIKGNIEGFDYLYIDEMQDLTEMQVLAITSLSKNPKNIYMTGDVSQTINPTFFMSGRMGVIFRNYYHLDINTTHTLNENFRNSEAVVGITQALLNLRVEKLGTYSDDILEESRQLDRAIGIPFWLESKKESMIEIASLWIDLPNVAIVVASDKDKQRLMKELKIDYDTNIYSVSEVKGYEFEKVLLFDVVSAYHDEWKAIMEGDYKKKSDVASKYKFFFNLYYVAITRARNHIFVYESKMPKSLETLLKPHFEVILENILDVMDLSSYRDIDETTLQAEAFFKASDYSRARTYYLRAENRHMAEICTGYEALQKGEELKGLKALYPVIEDKKQLFFYTSEEESPLFYLLTGVKSGSLNKKTINAFINRYKMKQLLEPFVGSEVYPSLMLDTLELYNQYYLNPKGETHV